ncbi:MAG: hypothetical protein KatS3mg088_358 [Patescibacteria group bacterium]|nr:MAG: hypothetical protein KatS3mg088_358 [Patescibacteria group bacterium]
MDYLKWYYSQGIKILVKKWLNLVKSVYRYFSPLHLLSSLFSPWKRMVLVYETTGFNLQKYIEVLTFNFISRFIGAIVRFFLLITGILVILLFLVLFIVLIPLWIIFPFWGVFDYQKFQMRPDIFLSNIFKRNDGDILSKIFRSHAGDFLLVHTGIPFEEIVSQVKFNSDLVSSLPSDSFESLISYLLSSNVWNDDLFIKYKLSKEDFVKTAKWWDDVQKIKLGFFDRPYYPSGLALELLTGYTPELDKYSVDLTAPQDFSHRLIGRGEVVDRMERSLSVGKSIFLVGPAGVGKKTIVLEFARRSYLGELGEKMAYKRILEFDYNSLLAESIDLNAKKTKLSQILKEASYAGNIILMIRDIHRITNSEVEGYDFTDVFEQNLDKGKTLVIAVLGNKEYERFVAPNLRLRKLFDLVEVEPPSFEEAFEIMIKLATKYEREKNIIIPIFVLRKIFDESDKYITETPFPEKALELLDAVVSFSLQNKSSPVSLDDVDSVLTEKIGVPFADITKTQKVKLENLESIIHERLVDQELAVSLIAKTLRSKTVGVVNEKRPIGSFLFLGPTGVGKTEVAKILSRVYFGSEEEIIRFDMAEFAGKEGLERLIGSVSGNLPGELAVSIRKNPAALLLLDEIEKSSREIMNIFLSLLDEGVFTDAFGNKVICRNLFVIGTSNAGAEYIRQLVASNTPKEEMQSKVVDYVLREGFFTPEFLNRFDGVVVFNPLSKDDLLKVAKLMLLDLAANLKKKGITLEITDAAIEKLANDGYEPAFGARPMRRIINVVLGDLFGKAILSGEIASGDKVRLSVVEEVGRSSFAIEKVVF